jgi:single-strand DNA-binding protein
MNQVMLVGTVLESEVRRTENSQVLKLRVKTATVVPREDGSKTLWDFHNVVYWGKSASVAHRQCPQGATVSVVGRLTSRSYEKDGEKRYITEVNASSVAPLVLPDGRTDEAGASS